MGKLIFVTGGARSGKSDFAEELAEKYTSRGYMATAIAFDNEMKDRIKKHQIKREDKFTTYECQYGFEDALKNAHDVFLLDCITVFISNLILKYASDINEEVDFEKQDTVVEKATVQMDNIIKKVKETNSDIIVVSNEVGLGIVPAYAMGRMFRDVSGFINKYIAKNADEAYFVVSGLPMRLK